MRTSVGAIDFVDHHDRTTAGRQRFFEHKAGLRHRAFGGIDQDQTAVGHLDHPFDLAAKVGVARGVNQVDLHALVGDGNVLGQNRDAPFSFQVVRIEDPFAFQFSSTELAALP